jgi:hypothetical protein
LLWGAHMNMLPITLSHYSHHLFKMFNEISIPRLYKINVNNVIHVSLEKNSSLQLKFNST